jgi:hypothetical protein
MTSSRLAYLDLKKGLAAPFLAAAPLSWNLISAVGRSKPPAHYLLPLP